MGDGEFALPPGTHTVAMGVGDLNGVMRGKRIPAARWETVREAGTAMSVALFAIDMTSDIWDTPYTNFDTGYQDCHVFPMEAPRALPWEPGVAFCMARAETMDHAPVPIDPRNVLLAQVERARAMGFEASIGVECECHLLDPQTLRPKDLGIQVYSLDRAAELEHVLGPIRRQIDAVGIPIEQSNPEYAPGQVEVNVRYADALTSADRMVAFRSLVKQLAMHHGYLATFMAKPFFDESGNGFHVHHSLWRDGANAFAEAGRLSKTGFAYLAGVQRRMIEASLCGTMTPNGYRRFQPLSFCPTNVAWGYDNRTAALRVIEGADAAVRVESRNGSADANPYLHVAAHLAAGLDGIEQGLTPEHFAEGNAYLMDEAPKLPTSAEAAVAAAKGSAWLKGVLGDLMHALMIQQAEREIGFVAAQVTPVEIERYLRNL
ncbi:MAG: glutamine synthetase family protein [Pseudomonadota bacterium]